MKAKYQYNIGQTYWCHCLVVEGRPWTRVCTQWTGTEFVFSGDDEHLGEVEMVLEFYDYPYLPKWERKA